MEHTITRRLNSTLDDLSLEFSTPFCEADFERALRILEKSDEGEKAQNQARIRRMLKKCGFVYRPTGKEKYSDYKKLVKGLVEQGVIVTMEKLSESLMGACEKLYEKYRDYPTSTAYMQRLVDRLSYPGDPWQKESLRLRILKQFIKYGNYLTAVEIGKQKPIQRYVGVKLGKEKATDDEVLQYLDDNVFLLLDIPSTKDIEQAMCKAAAAVPNEVQGHKLRELILNPENASLPSSFDDEDYQSVADLLLHPETLEHLMENLLLQHAAQMLGKEVVTEEEAKSVLDAKTCMILSQLGTKGMKNAIENSENRKNITKALNGKLKSLKKELELLDEKLKEANDPILEEKKAHIVEPLLAHLYSSLRKVIRKKNGEDYGLLQVADNLASGLFKTNGGSKRDLYLFAIVYDMTYYSRTGDAYDEERDVEKNLFTDYYAANVLQYLSPTYLNGKTSGEIIPSGCSINYKNFAEMIYLYCICRDRREFLTEEEEENLPEDEQLKRTANGKIKKAVEMIKKVKVLDKDAEVPATADRQAEATVKMKELVSGASGQINSEKVMEMSEADFLKFIEQHYDRRVYIDKASVSPFQVNAEDRTALTEYTRIVKKLFGSSDEPQESIPFLDYLMSIRGLKDNIKDPEYDKNANRDLSREFSYGLCFDEAHWEAPGISNKNKEKGTSQEETEPADEVYWVSEGKPRNIDWDFYQLLRSVDKLLRSWLEEPEKVNRTKLLAALYYEFNENQAFPRFEQRVLSFQEHYNLFRSKVNPVLETCNYALISCKSLLDMLVIFSSYIYINA